MILSKDDYMERLKSNDLISEADSSNLYDSILLGNYDVVGIILDHVLNRLGRTTLNSILFKEFNTYLSPHRERVTAGFTDGLLNAQLDDMVAVVNYYGNEDYNGNYLFHDLVGMDDENNIIYKVQHEIGTHFISQTLGKSDLEIKTILKRFTERFHKYAFDNFDYNSCSHLLELIHYYHMMKLLPESLRDDSINIYYETYQDHIILILKMLKYLYPDFNPSLINASKIGIRYAISFGEGILMDYLRRFYSVSPTNTLLDIFDIRTNRVYEDPATTS